MRLFAFPLALMVGALSVAPALAAASDASLRPEVGRPLEKAKRFFDHHNYAASLAQIRIAESVRNLTPRERLVVAEMRGATEQASSDTASAARTYEGIIASGQVTGADLQKLAAADASLTYGLRDYARTIAAIDHYHKAGGHDPAFQALLIQALYQRQDFAGAARLEAAQIQLQSTAGQQPTEAQLQLLAASQQQAGDTAGLRNTLQLLVLHYPNAGYWTNLIQRVQASPGFSDRLALDVYRLRRAVGTLTTTADYVDYAEQAVVAGLPGEASAVLEEGYARKLLGNGAEAPRQARLKTLADSSAADSRHSLGQLAAQAGSDPNQAEIQGERLIALGDVGQGTALIERSLHGTGLRHPDEARLHLGIAYVRAGQTTKGVQVLRTVGGIGGTADLAQLWILYASRHSL